MNETVIYVQIAVIGAGPAGMAAAIEAKKNGIQNVIILEREDEPGGILKQCIHTGFGLHIFKQELTGPEYAQRFIDSCGEFEIPIFTDTMVLSVSPDKIIKAVNSKKGVFEIHAQAVILATGCRERPRGALMIPGNRPAGIFTAGTAQRYVNIEGMLPGRDVVILGSGDIGLIMARRLTLEGAKVLAVVELKEYSTGLQRNIVQCLEDFDIPLLLSHTIVNIHGDKRVSGVTIAKVDSKYRPIAGTEKYLSCDTLLLSVGLIPENELANDAGIRSNAISNAPVIDENLECSIPGIFACGNALQVHDLADDVTLEARHAGKSAASYILKRVNNKPHLNIRVEAGNGLQYILPNLILFAEEDVSFSFRANNIFKNILIRANCGGNTVFETKKIKVTPGQMEYVVIKKNILSTLSGTLTFELQEEYNDKTNYMCKLPQRL